MKIVLLTASNAGLIVGIIFGICFFVGFATVTTKLIIEVIKPKKPEQRIKALLSIPFGLFFSLVGIYIVILEYNILRNFTYVEGTTLHYCRSGKSGQGIEFEYHLNGKRFTNCNTHNPLQEIKVPGGKFKVRVSKFAPDIGRIDFEQPLTSNSLLKEQ
jgi:hypothetical protein